MFWDNVRKPPSVQDVQALLRTSGAGSCVTAINALIFVILGVPHEAPLFLIVWFSLTFMICIIVFARTRRASARDMAYVSRKAARRVNIFAAVLALPWAMLAFAELAVLNSEGSLIVIMICAGMSAGGTFMLHRTTLAALIYYTLILGSVVASAHLGGAPFAVAITFYAIVYGGFLCYFGLRTAETARELDRSVGELELIVSELETSQRQNHRLANVDEITNLPNRNAFNRYLDQLIRKAIGHQCAFSLFLLDLDHFKNVNDLYGHAFGDDLLGLIGARLEHHLCQSGNEGARLSDGGFVARLGGDEFVIIEQETDIAMSMSRARELIAALNEPVDLDGKQIFPGVSIGVARFPAHGHTPSELTRNADLALNQAKETGRGVARVFDDNLRSAALLRDRLETALRAALCGDQITVCYQPKICLKTLDLSGAEALVRWHNPELGASTPDVFLPIAAESGLLPALSQRIIEIVARDMRAWRQVHLNVGRIAINVHPLELRSPDLLMKNIDFLDQQGAGPDDLTIEVTEGCLVGRGSEATQFTLDRLVERGYELSLDDFGTGYASLSHLRNLHVSEIKIDKSFVSALPESESDHAIVAATIQLAQGMGLKTVAEGIETKAQMQSMVELGVDHGQGFYWSRALSAADFSTYVRDHSKAAPTAASG